ncbi:MAG TPA: RIP metalloprotease [Solirubrobacteraceae bacterium]|nr:RIP metalloprotease [Solirubrobacteraceae bacterium]
MSWFLTILGILLLIILHELGHFTVAKLVGMRVERFSLFFPPTLFKVRRGETEYAIGAIPAGGYVKITGMNPEEIAELEPEVAKRAYYAQAPWKRIVVILAGPGVNIVIAFVLFWAVLFSGSLSGASAIYNLDPATNAVAASSTVQAVAPGAPASATLRAGDRIVAVDGSAVSEKAARSRIDAHRCAGVPTDGCRASAPAMLTVHRAGKTLQVSVLPRYSKAAKRMLIGVEFGVTAKPFGVLAAAGSAIGAMWHATTGTLTGFAKALTSSKTRSEVSSIVGITKVAHETVVAGPGIALVFLGYISLVLAVINLFPFLPLDGGHILWSVAEKLRGRRISLVAMYRFSSVGIILLLFLVINGVSNDISRLGG